ncbi:substrate-binding periplasmic protein [Undibacterium pigrum]|uniref:Amino acid ABC transporter substrate-binding protein (PAAT family) n=1 Tax=Undibacterium pigrum TaxID=401470 RepID=A0A318JCV8_9BURK|nr:transporter substrate-binding domain-containing protein [Undibacterium pigrum]PXX45436.1 amino acid ABC transporter substrate-binding protein (PAAT family) [Undibacterium pigrum]
MQRRTLLQFASLSGLIGLPALAQQNKVLQISTLIEKDPATSIAEKIMETAYRKLGINFNVHYLPGERSLRSSNNGEMDAELYRKLGMERDYPNLIIVPVPLMTYEIVIFTYGTNFVVTGWESLRPYTIGFVKGIKIIEQNTLGMKLESAPTVRQAFQKMLLGRSDVVVANRISGQAALNELKQTDIGILMPPLATFPVFHYVNKKHEALVPALTAVLQKMQKDKVIENIQTSVMAEWQRGE